jgi:sugar phosphate permease
VPVERATRQCWVVWTTAVIVYVFSVFHRTSLGVAGLQVSARFGVGPAALGTFAVVQMSVYAAMQVPTGLLVDRFGPRRILTAAALLVGAGQVLFGLANSYPLGLAARGVLGFGDALTWVSILRLIAAHFPARRYAVVVSLSAALGCVGNVVSTVPLTMLLRSAGWTATFVTAGVATACYAAFAALRVRDAPAGAHAPVVERVGLRQALARVGVAWRVPGTRLGFWVHFSTMVAPTTLGMLWGTPYLVQAQGMSAEAAGALLALQVLVGFVSSPTIGAVTARRPEWRMPIVAGFVVGAIVMWGALLAWPGGHPPVWLITTAFVVLSIGGPASTIGFALARDYNPLYRVGTATGVVNVGGFVSATVAAFGVGVLLDVAGMADPARAFRVAFLAVAAVLLVGCWRTAVWWRRTRAAVFEAEARGEVVPVRLRVRRWDAVVAPAVQPALAAA